MKRRLVRCHPQAYSEIIMSNIPGTSGANPAQLPILRPSPPSIMKPSLPPVSKSSSSFSLKPLIVKPTQGELRALLEVLAKKRRSVKWKTRSSPKGCPLARGKILKVGVSSSPLCTVEARDSSRRAAEPPLKVLSILVWSPTSQGAKPPPPHKCQMMWEGVALVLWGMRTLCFLMWSSSLRLFPPSFALSTSRRWTPCPLRRFWL